MKNKGFTLIELMIVIAIIGILAMIAIPNFVSLRAKAYGASASSAAHNLRIAEELWFQDQPEGSATYTDNLSDLITKDKNLADDGNLTFDISGSDTSGYTYTVSHAKGGDPAIGSL